eukprot:scaffold34921_cov162-Amphora_coffeaeformis.AAC.22
MAIPTSPTTKKGGKSMYITPPPPPPPPPPHDYPPNSPTHHIVTRHPGGSYSSPRAHARRGVLGVSLSPYGPYTVPLSHAAGRGMAPGLPFTDGPPEPSQQRKAMEAAVMVERTRSVMCEKEEANMTADELREVLKKERRRTAKIAADLASFKCSAVQQQLESEVFEEGRINGLMRTVDHLQHELEREDQMRIFFFFSRPDNDLIINKQNKLEEVRREKAKLEQQIDQEKNANTKLLSQLSDLRNSQVTMATNLEAQDEMEEE